MICLSASILAATFTCAVPSIDTVDPVKVQSTYDCHAVKLLYETPLEIDYRARPYKLTPGVCELPDISADGLVYTMRIVPDCALTAHDVKRSLDALRFNKAASGSWILKNVENIEALDAATVRITLKTKQHVFPWMLAMAHSGISDANGEATGPYKLKSWRKNHEMVFERNCAWRGWESMELAGIKGKPFDEIRYVVVPNVTTQWLMFLKGEIDFLANIGRDNWSNIIGRNGKIDPSLESRGIKLHGGDSAVEIRYLGFNMNDPVVGNNKKLRQALSCAFNYPTWRLFYNRSIAYAKGPVPPIVEGYLATPFEYSFSIKRAKRLLAEAGYPNGKDPATGRRLCVELTIGRPTRDSREAGELLASFYERIGVKLKLRFMTWSAFLDTVNRGDVQLYMLAWVADYPDPENFLQLFYSKNKSPGTNRSCYNNKEFDAEYEKAMACDDVEKRNEHWRKCQEIVREDCPWIYTHITKHYTLTNPRVDNYEVSDFPYGFEKYYRVKE